MLKNWKPMSTIVPSEEIRYGDGTKTNIHLKIAHVCTSPHKLIGYADPGNTAPDDGHTPVAKLLSPTCVVPPGSDGCSSIGDRNSRVHALLMNRCLRSSCKRDLRGEVRLHRAGSEGVTSFIVRALAMSRAREPKMTTVAAMYELYF